ncbi:hypothetical protein Q3G72_033358 [Acer saccharum]|nr:hypothetical protein Q3G72_033358 [Acer saccharum]
MIPSSQSTTASIFGVDYCSSTLLLRRNLRSWPSTTASVSGEGDFFKVLFGLALDSCFGPFCDQFGWVLCVAFLALSVSVVWPVCGCSGLMCGSVCGTRLQMVDDFSNHEVGGEDFPTSTTNNDEQNPSVNEVLKVGKMGWINYFRVEAKKVDSTGKSKTRAEIGHAYRALSIEDKAPYVNMSIDNVASTTHSNKQTQQNPPETHEECGATEIDIGVDDQNMVVIAELVTKASNGGKHQVDPPSFVSGHGTPSVMVSDVGTSNKATPDTILRELKLMRAEIIDLKSKVIGRDEFDDLKRKVNHIYEYFRDEDGKEHGNKKKKVHISEDEGKEHSRLRVMNPKQEGTIDSVDHSHRIPNSPIHCTDTNFKPSSLSFSTLPRPIKPTIFEVSSTDTKPSTKDPKGKSRSNERWLNAPLVNSNVISHLEDLPIDERIDDDHDESTDDYDILNVKVPNFVPSLIDEDIKDDELEFSSKPSTKKTRTSNQRRPSRFKSSPFVCGPSPSKRGKKFKYRPFQISRALSEIDGQIIDYIFSSNLPSAEIILDLPGIQVKRNSFRSLKPRAFIDSEIVSAVSEYRTMMMKRSRSSLRWYLTTYFGYSVLGSDNGQPPKLENLIGGFKNTYMYDLRRCEQATLVKVKEQIVEIWDSLPPRRKDDQTRTSQVRSLMHALDIVLSNEISVDFPSTFSFSSFTITTVDAPKHENCFDCGLFVCMFMDDNYPSPNEMVTFDSETYRLLLARFLAVLQENNQLKQLQLHAQYHHKELLSKGLHPNGKKRPGGITNVKGVKR